MKTIYHCYSDEVEAEGFFDVNDVLLASWSLNDASYRKEYMKSLFSKLGIVVEYSDSQEHLDVLKGIFG